MSSNDNKRIQSIDSIETYTYGTSKDLVCEKEETKQFNKTIQTCLNMIKYVTKENIYKHNSNWPPIPDHP